MYRATFICTLIIMGEWVELNPSRAHPWLLGFYEAFLGLGHRMTEGAANRAHSALLFIVSAFSSGNRQVCADAALITLVAHLRPKGEALQVNRPNVWQANEQSPRVVQYHRGLLLHPGHNNHQKEAQNAKMIETKKNIVWSWYMNLQQG